MQKEIKEKLEEVVALLNDPEETVMEKEIKEKLEKILVLLNNPENIEMDKKERKEKLEKVVVLLENAMIDPDIDIDYCIPGVKTTVAACKESGDPYILITYIVGDYNKPTRKIHLGSTALTSSPEKIANQITASIEEFKSEIDAVEMG